MGALFIENQKGGEKKTVVKQNVDKKNGGKNQNGVSTCCELCVEVEIGRCPFYRESKRR